MDEKKVVRNEINIGDRIIDKYGDSFDVDEVCKNRTRVLATNKKGKKESFDMDDLTFRRIPKEILDSSLYKIMNESDDE